MRKLLIMSLFLISSFIFILKPKALDTEISHGRVQYNLYKGIVPSYCENNNCSSALGPVTMFYEGNVGDTSYAILNSSGNTGLYYDSIRMIDFNIYNTDFQYNKPYLVKFVLETGSDININSIDLNKRVVCSSCDRVSVSYKEISSSPTRKYELSVFFLASSTTNSMEIVIGNNSLDLLNFAYLFYNTHRTSSEGIRINSVNVYLLDDDSALLGGIQNAINANLEQTINLINNSSKTNEKLDNINNSLTDDTPPDTSEFGDVSGWLPSGPVDSIITLPLNALNSISNSLNGNCSTINLPLPFIDSTLPLTCGTDFYSQVSGLSLFLNSLFTILGGITLYKYFVYLYNWVDRIVSLKEDDEKWGAV